jgi:hypothetical protein
LVKLTIVKKFSKCNIKLSLRRYKVKQILK